MQKYNSKREILNKPFFSKSTIQLLDMTSMDYFIVFPCPLASGWVWPKEDLGG